MTAGKSAYTIGWLFHAATLLAGAALMVHWLSSTREHFADQSFEVALGELVTALMVLSLCMAHAFVLLRRGFSPVATFFFLLSYPFLGLILSAALRGMAKKFAPATPEEAQTASLIAVAMIVLICSFSIIGVIASYRAAGMRSTP